MLYAFGFQQIGVVVSDLYFINPDPEAGQEGAERGVRLELRMLRDGALKGSIYSARPIAIDRPLWRVDLLESVDGPTGSLNRAHHHPRFDGWEPGRRVFVKELSADPLKWVGQRLADLPGVLADAGVAEAEVAATDAERLRESAPQILEVLDRLLKSVWSGDLGRPPCDQGEFTEARVSWL